MTRCDSRRLPPILATLAAATLATAAGAQCVGMPAGSPAYIELSNSSTPCGEVATGIRSIPYPSPNYCEPSSCAFGRVLLVNADNRPNRMRISSHMERGSLPAISNAMGDTYTLTGPAGTSGTPVTFRVRFHAVGTIYSSFHTVLNGNPIYVQGGPILAEVGFFAPDSNSDFHEQFRINTFGPQFAASANMAAAQTPTPRSQPVDLLIDQPLTRNAGEPFDIGFGLTSGVGTLGNLAGSNSPPDSDYLVATVDFDLPPGFTITSVQGWTDPDAPACGSADFDGDGDLGTDGDIEAFFACLAGNCCASCGSADFNNDGDLGTDADIESFFRVLAGGTC